MIKIDNISVIILSAGLSQRFGKPKAFLNFTSEKTFIEEIIDRYTDNGFSNIVIVTNPILQVKLIEKLKKYDSAVKIVVNNFPELGRISSIKFGAKQLIGKNVFIHNIDNPFVPVEDLKKMVKLLKPNSFVKPVNKGKGGHPVLLSKEITLALSKIQEYNLSLKNFLLNYAIIEHSTNNAQILTNINTEDDFKNIFQ